MMGFLDKKRLPEDKGGDKDSVSIVIGDARVEAGGGWVGGEMEKRGDDGVL